MSSASLSTVPARGHHVPAAGLTVAAVVLVLALPELVGDLGRLAAVLVLQLGLVLAWVTAAGVQGFGGSLAVGAAAAVAADLALVLPARPGLDGLLLVFGPAFVAVVLQQMFRRPREELVASLSGAVLMLSAVGALAALLLVGRGDGDGRATAALLAVGAAAVVGHLVDLVLPRPQVTPGVPRGMTALVLAVAAGAAAAFLARGSAGTTTALASGAVLGLVAALVGLVASYVVVEVAAEEDGRVPAWAPAVVQAVLPLAACAPVATGLQNVL